MFSLPCLYLCGSYPSTRQINRLLVVQFDSIGFTIRCNDFIVARIYHSYTFAFLSHIVLIYLHIVIYLIPTHFHPHRLCLWCTNAHYLSRNLHNYLLNLQNLLHRYLFIVGLTIQLYNFCIDIVGLTIQLQKSSNFFSKTKNIIFKPICGLFVDVKRWGLPLCYFT